MTRSIRRVLGYGVWGLLVFALTSGLTAQILLLPRARAELERDLRAIYNPERVEVSFDSRAFLVALTTATLPRLTVELDTVDSGPAASAADRFITSVQFSRVTFDLARVHFDRRRVLGGVSAFEAEHGEMTARISEAEFNRFLKSEGFGVTVTIGPGEVSATADVVADGARPFKISAKSVLEITGTALALTPGTVDQKGVEIRSARLALEAVVPIPPVAGVRATSIELLEDQIVLRAPVTRLYGEAPVDTGLVEGETGAEARVESSPDASARRVGALAVVGLGLLGPRPTFPSSLAHLGPRFKSTTSRA